MEREARSLPADSLKTNTEQTHSVQLPLKQAPMVNWYQPKMLLRVAMQTVVSSTFGEHADFRYLESLQHQSKIYYDYSLEYKQLDGGGYEKDPQGFYIPDSEKPREEIWIDYISDTADGWNSTYGVAYWATRDSLSVRDRDGGEHRLPGGHLLIFGGDQVYPAPSRHEYRNRLINPYGAACPERTAQPHPRVFAIPGNHDWYDSLVQFTGIFCSKHWFNRWQTPQTCSYFALKLPHGWWLLGTDMQLRSELDQQQLRYFEGVCAQIGEEDRVILCNAESWWIDAKRKGEIDPGPPDNTLDFLAQTLLGKKIRVYLAGNQHYYRRFEHDSPAGKAVKITAGGGGAFLHPTHDIQFDTVEDVFEQSGARTTRAYTHAVCYPDRETSRRLARGNLLFLWKNKSFGLVTALLYLFTAWLFRDVRLHHVLPPSVVLWVGVVLAGFWFFTDTISRRYKLIAGLLHGSVHLAVIYLLCGLALRFSSPAWSLLEQQVFEHLFLFLGGWLFGSLIMGLYLYISLNVFGRHYSEAFSSLHNENWKNFLRLHIDQNGTLTIYPIGLQRVPRHWKKRPADASGPLFEPDDPRATPPELIEPPIVVI
jgi:hypothetical protein